jgi:hypothetical protein
MYNDDNTGTTTTITYIYTAPFDKEHLRDVVIDIS